MEERWETALALDDLEDGEVRSVRFGSQAVVLVRIADAVHATEAVCPHKFGPLEDGHVEGGCLVCPLHDAHFDPATGAPRSGDGWAGRLAVYACRVRDGNVEVSLEDGAQIQDA